MSSSLPLNSWPTEIIAIARTVRAAGGRALIVGGSVRDRLLGRTHKDLDVEVYGLPLSALQALLTGFGEVIEVGRVFGVFRLKQYDIDFSLPRTDSKTGAGHRGFDVVPDPQLPFASAARRRDLTINAMAIDPLSGEILDAYGGRQDLAARRLRATDAMTFGDDALRALRVAQFAARLEFTVDSTLASLCAAMDLAELSAERIAEEFDKLLLCALRPSIGLEFLQQTRLLRFFPELAALDGVAQDPTWHPEGDVWTHTLMVVDCAATDRRQDGDDRTLMFAALCHDFGKAITTAVEGGRIRSPGHDIAGVELTYRFLQRLKTGRTLQRRVAALVRYHLAPALYVGNQAGPKGYRRLSRALADADVSLELLVRVARADHLGRTTAEALAQRFPAGDEFLARACALTVARSPPPDRVLGRHLIARGLIPGPHFATLLAHCREWQDEHGETDPDRILNAVLKDNG